MLMHRSLISDPVASVGESWDQERCLGACVASLAVSMAVCLVRPEAS